MNRTNRVLATALVAVGTICGCSNPGMIAIVDGGPKLDAAGKPRIVRGTPTITETVNPDGSASYLVRFDLEPIVPGQILRPIEVRASLTTTEFSEASVEGNGQRKDGRELVTVQFGNLPPGTPKARLNLEIDGSRGSLSLDGLRGSPERPHLDSSVKTPYGPILAYGIRDFRRRSADQRQMAGIALDLPWRAGFVRRLRDLDVYPAFGGTTGARLTSPVEEGTRPGLISLDRFHQSRWEAAGKLDFLSVGEQGELTSAKSPVFIRNVNVLGRTQPCVVPKGTLPEGSEAQIQRKDGLWCPVGEGQPLSSLSRLSLYRILHLAETIPFAVQEETINELPVTAPDFRFPEASVSFDLNDVIAAATTKDSIPAIGRTKS